MRLDDDLASREAFDVHDGVTPLATRAVVAVTVIVPTRNEAANLPYRFAEREAGGSKADVRQGVQLGRHLLRLTRPARGGRVVLESRPVADIECLDDDFSRASPRFLRWARSHGHIAMASRRTGGCPRCLLARRGERPRGPAATCDPVAARAMSDLTVYTSWLDEHRVAGVIGEVGWPSAPNDGWKSVAGPWISTAVGRSVGVYVWETAEN